VRNLFGVAKRFCKANTSVEGHNLIEDDCSKSDGCKSYTGQCLRDRGQRENFKFRAEKGLEKNNLERSKEKERRNKGEKLWNKGRRYRILIERGEKRRNVGNAARRGIFVMNVRLTLPNKEKIRNSRVFRGDSIKKSNAPKNVEKVIRVSKNIDPFVFRGKINDKFCDFKLDTCSDITVINPRLVNESEQHIPLENERLRYPTGEKVPMKFISQVKVELGKYSYRMVVYVAEIGENCILGTDFCLQTGIDEVFRSAILESSQEKKSEYLFYRRIFSASKEVLDGYRELYEQDSQEMDVSQRGIFADLLKEFQDVFSE